MLPKRLTSEPTTLSAVQLRRLHRAGLLAILAIAGVVAIGGAALQYSARWVQHTREVLRTVRELQSILLLTESQALQAVSESRPRGAVRQRDSVATQVSVDSAAAAPALLRLIQLTGDNPPQQERASEISRMVGAWMVERRLLASGQADTASSQASAALLTELNAFQALEASLYEARVIRQQRWRLLLIGSVMAALALTAFALHRMTRNVAREAQRRLVSERERDQAEELLAFALHRSPLAVGVLAADGTTLVSNDLWRGLAEQFGTGLHHALHPIVERVRMGGGPALEERNIVVPAPEREAHDARTSTQGGAARGTAGARTVTVSAQRVDGATEGGVGVIIIDITEQRWLETQLRHAQRMEALGRLAGGVAHDINNVVTAIIGFTDMAILGTQRGKGEAGQEASPDELQVGDASDTPASQVERDLQQVRRSADRAAMMARQLLAFSRQSVARRRPIDVAEVVQDLDPMLRRILGSHINFTVKKSEPRWAVSADPGLVEQIVLNLAINARDAMEHGGELVVEVRSVRESDVASLPGVPGWAGASIAGDVVAIAVRDSGSGIPAELVSRIFEPFFTTKAEGKGTGLGLATVRQIVEDLGGYLLIDSVPGQGTTMTVVLARVLADPEPLRLSTRARRTVSTPASILLVEDDREVRYLAEYVLSDAGHTVQTARNGDEAIAAIARSTQPIDLVVTDLVMPDIGGAALGSHPVVRDRVGRTLYVSGYPAESLGAQTRLPSEVAFLAKPFTPAELLEAVDRTLRETPR